MFRTRLAGVAAVLACAAFLVNSPVFAALTPVWETAIPDSSDEDAGLVLGEPSSLRILSRNILGQLRYVSLNSSGTIVLSTVFPVTADGLNRRILGAAAMQDGGAVVCGANSQPPLPPNPFPTPPDANAMTVRFSPSGAGLWQRVFSDADTASCGEQVISDCAARSGAVYIVGNAAPPPPVPFPSPTCPFVPSNFVSFIMRLDPTGGATMASRVLRASEGGPSYGAVAVSSAGTVYAFGTRAGAPTVLDRYDADLNLQGTVTIPISLTPVAAAVSSQGVVALLGQQGTLAARVMRFTLEGVQLGDATIPMREARGLTITDQGTVYVTGNLADLGNPEKGNVTATIASVSPAGGVTVERSTRAARSYITSAVDANGTVFATVDGPGLRATRFSTAAAASSGQLSIKPGTDNQVGIVRQSLPAPLTVLVRDASSVPVAGVPVVFAVSSEPVSGARARVLPTNTQSSLPDGAASTVFTVGGLPLEYKVSCTCPTCGVGGSSVTFTACGKLANDDFEQFDARWSTSPYANTTTTMGEEGCAVTSLATMNNFYRNTVSTAIPQVDPDSLNRGLRGLGRQGYVGAGRVVWSGINQLSGNNVLFQNLLDVDSGDTADAVRAAASDQLELGRPVVMRVRRQRANGTFGTHFILAVGRCGDEFIIADPGSATRTRFNPNDAAFRLLGVRIYEPAP